MIDDAYTHANRTLLRLLLRDQQLILRLRSLKRYFFLSQSSFLTHLLDLSHSELRKSAKSASLVKLQSLLDLALNTDALGEDAMFREDVKVTMATSGLYDWLLKVVRVSGDIDGVDGAKGNGQEESKKDKDDKKQMLGNHFCHNFNMCCLLLSRSHRCPDTRLQCQISPLIGHFPQDDPPLPADIQIPPASEARRIIVIRYVDRAQNTALAP